MSLYLKHRPTSLDDVRGNADAVKALRAWAAKPPADRPRTLLFSGPSGCGKTTLARIAASLAGASGRDFREVDSADYRGIDSVREVRDQMRLAPTQGERRAWLLDECHKLTNDAQNALLKALEDTPPHVLFILATTDPQKLLPTIRNRCLPFTVAPLAPEEVAGLLKAVGRAERKRIAEAAVQRIAQDCGGSARAALVMLDKIIDLPQDEQAAAVEAVAAQEEQVIDLCRALLKGEKWKGLAPRVKALKEQEQDAENVRRVVLGYMQSVLLGGQANVRAAYAIEAFRAPTYDIGWPGVTLAAFDVVQNAPAF